MKNIFKILLILFSISCFSQTIEQRPLESFYQPNQPNHVYYKDVNNLLDKYIGTWEYNDGTHYFKIEFFKQSFYRETPVANPKVTIYTDRIFGHYQYKLNGAEIYNVTNMKYANSRSGSFFNGFYLIFSEPTTASCGRSKIGYVNLQYSNSGGIEQLTWSRTDKNMEMTWCQSFDSTPFKTPANMVLTKVN